MELRDNEIQKELWKRPIADVLMFEHMRAAEDYELRNLVKGAIAKFADDYRSEGLEVSRDQYARNLAHNDRLSRLRAYAEGKPMNAMIGYLTHEIIAKDLARLIQS